MMKQLLLGIAAAAGLAIFGGANTAEAGHYCGGYGYGGYGYGGYGSYYRPSFGYGYYPRSYGYYSGYRPSYGYGRGFYGRSGISLYGPSFGFRYRW